VVPDARLDTLHEPVPGQLRQEALGLLSQVDEAAVAVDSLLLGPEELNQDARFASGQLIKGVAGRRQVHQRQVVEDVGVRAIGGLRTDRAHPALERTYPHRSRQAGCRPG
jgi:hypothetical protein